MTLAFENDTDHPRIHESKRQIAVPVADSGTVNGSAGSSPAGSRNPLPLHLQAIPKTHMNCGFVLFSQLPDLFQRTDAAGLIVSLSMFSCLYLSGGLDKTQHSHRDSNLSLAFVDPGMIDLMKSGQITGQA